MELGMVLPAPATKAFPWGGDSWTWRDPVRGVLPASVPWAGMAPYFRTYLALPLAPIGSVRNAVHCFYARRKPAWGEKTTALWATVWPCSGPRCPRCQMDKG